MFIRTAEEIKNNMYETEYGYYGKNILSYIEEWINNQ